MLLIELEFKESPRKEVTSKFKSPNFRLHIQISIGSGCYLKVSLQGIRLLFSIEHIIHAPMVYSS